MNEKATLKYLRPSLIQVPTVRVTSCFDEDILKEFKDSIREMGIVEPIVVGQDGDEFYLIDGLHRLEEAKLNNMLVIPCVVIQATQKEILLKNLILNRMRGRVKPSEMVKVVSLLRREYQMDTSEISKATGLGKQWVEELLKASETEQEVKEALDEGKISVSHASELARVKDRDIQLRLLAQTLQYNLRSRDLRDVVDNTLKLMEARKEEIREEPRPRRELVNIAKCDFCKNDKPIRFIQGFNVCNVCYTWAMEYIEKKIAEELELRAKMAVIAEEAISSTKIEENLS